MSLENQWGIVNISPSVQCLEMQRYNFQFEEMEQQSFRAETQKLFLFPHSVEQIQCKQKRGGNVVTGLDFPTSVQQQGLPKNSKLSCLLKVLKLIVQNAFQVRKGLLVNKREDTPSSSFFPDVRTRGDVQLHWVVVQRSKRSIYGAIIEGDIPSANLPNSRGIFSMKIQTQLFPLYKISRHLLI